MADHQDRPGGGAEDRAGHAPEERLLNRAGPSTARHDQVRLGYALPGENLFGRVSFTNLRGDSIRIEAGVLDALLQPRPGLSLLFLLEGASRCAARNQPAQAGERGLEHVDDGRASVVSLRESAGPGKHLGRLRGIVHCDEDLLQGPRPRARDHEDRYGGRIQEPLGGAPENTIVTGAASDRNEIGSELTRHFREDRILQPVSALRTPWSRNLYTTDGG